MKLRILVIVGLLALVGLAVGGCSMLQKGPALTNWEPALSPDGKQIAYESPGTKGFEIYLLDVATDKVTQLTHNDIDDWSPSWSPDGNKIAFVSNQNKNVDLYIIDLKTNVITRLTKDPKDDVNPQWGMDNRILFNSNRTGAWEIYEINPDGTGLKQITHTPAATK